VVTPPRPRFTVGLALGFLLAAGLVAQLGPSLPALAQPGGRIPLEPFRAEGLGVVLATVERQECDLSPVVPVGKLLVVQAIYAAVQVSNGEAVTVGVSPSAGQFVPLPLNYQGPAAGRDLGVSGSPASRLYLDAGPPRAIVSTTPAGTALSHATVVGHLVPAPTP
jgi:hypothetical protein